MQQNQHTQINIMKGNIYICLNEETYNSEIPDLLSRYRRAEFDE